VTARKSRSPRGFALLIVLWAITLAALIGTEITALGRRETQIAANLRTQAVIEAAADGAVYEAAFAILRGEAGWHANGAVHIFVIGGITVRVRVRDERGKIDVNAAPAPLLASLFGAVGVDTGTAQRLAAAIVGWRSVARDLSVDQMWDARYRAAGDDYLPTFSPMESVGELRLPLGMNSKFLDAIRPHVTLYGSAMVDARYADPVVTAALRSLSTQSAAATQVTFTPTARIIAVDAIAAGSDGSRFERRAILRLGGGPNGFAIFRWTE
jgi:general secretion pathway protein K